MKRHARVRFLSVSLFQPLFQMVEKPMYVNGAKFEQCIDDDHEYSPSRQATSPTYLACLDSAPK